MSDSKKSQPFDWVRWSRSMVDLGRRGQQILLNDMERRARDGDLQVPDPRVVTESFVQLWSRLASDPSRLAEAQMGFWRANLEVWEAACKVYGGPGEGEHENAPAPPAADRRFKDAAWNEPPFDLIRRTYLANAHWLLEVVRGVEDLDEETRRKADFYTRQCVDALAPTNFLATNPKVWQEALDSGGDSLLKGLDHLLRDLERGQGRLSIAMTDLEAFRVGENLATTPGKVIFQNDLMQLIQYEPTTPTAHRRPLLIVPPWINKFYILDLQPRNSFIRWAVESGHTVFVISWVNPDERHAGKGFEDYLTEGPLAALDRIRETTGEASVNAIGYCIGGTLLACTLAYLAAKGSADRIRSATFFTALVDFAEVGELAVFIDDQQLRLLDEQMQAVGYLDGRHMAQVFNLLRANDLIWAFVVNNYLLGKEPRAFDLLYWNSDSTRMPAMMHSFYLRKMYLENQLVEPGGITLLGVPIDLRAVRTPIYILSTREDHIAPWKATYAATQLYSGPVKFVLGASGHIAGVINPPASNKYGYWANPRKPRSPDTWLARAEQHEGSWWPDWARWVGRHGGGQVPARQPGGGKLKPLEEAPGSYVKVRYPG